MSDTFTHISDILTSTPVMEYDILNRNRIRGQDVPESYFLCAVFRENERKVLQNGKTH